MSVKLKEVKGHISRNSQIHKVTSALQKVSAARLSHDRRTIHSSDAYTSRLREVLNMVLLAADGFTHPLLKTGRQGKSCVIVFGSDRGLCGGFNRKLLEAAEKFADSNLPEPTTFIVMGGILCRRLQRRGHTIDSAPKQPVRVGRAGPLDVTVERVTRGFIQGEFRDVHVMFSQFISGLDQLIAVERVFPVAFEAYTEDVVKSRLRVAEFEPAPARLLGRLLPEFVRQVIDNAFLNSLASENAARQAAMSRAADNAEKILSELMLSYRRLRQESITTEMIELAGGGRV